MKIGVVGTFIRDKIFPWKGEQVESIGGSYFNVSYLANLAEPETEICPVACVGADFYEQLVDQIKSYKNLRLNGIKRVADRNTQVNLYYTGPQDRYEVTSAPMPPLGKDEMSILEDADAVLVNLITGTDVELSALQEFRKNSNALIYLDFHSYALGIDEQGRRYYRRPNDWRDWVALVDVLQLNEMEARTLAGFSSDLPNETLTEFGKQILEMGPDVCHITLGQEGTYLFYCNDDQARVKEFEALPVSDVVDIIGCGDAFAAGYLMHYFFHHDVEAATEFGIEVAGINCTFMGSSGIDEIRRVLRKRRKNLH
ncbi:carbohydrate kinase family protein [candidate division KSB1 bacterium]|nr:carbohydrate kinase family protein [candidate division KSB1 bacterium]NIR72812.1 carbohydrate kinase family protein [candidate division KSB1 bacterium]NIS26852.1 carbohydrate kinase family protein [candidate division KSB1 bacterium]NIT73648.1 carbohydrate kinase family protein [candidate division KSB1 bacterium]NIU27519.1 carbohydrate kinase family protein [candidate division KSB1 bacterium]